MHPFLNSTIEFSLTHALPLITANILFNNSKYQIHTDECIATKEFCINIHYNGINFFNKLFIAASTLHYIFKAVDFTTYINLTTILNSKLIQIGAATAFPNFIPSLLVATAGGITLLSITYLYNYINSQNYYDYRQGYITGYNQAYNKNNQSPVDDASANYRVGYEQGCKHGSEDQLKQYEHRPQLTYCTFILPKMAAIIGITLATLSHNLANNSSLTNLFFTSCLSVAIIFSTSIVEPKMSNCLYQISQNIPLINEVSEDSIKIINTLFIGGITIALAPTLITNISVL